MLLVPWILFHPLVVLEAFEDDLTEAVKVGYVRHLGVKELRHERSGSGWIVYL